MVSCRRYWSQCQYLPRYGRKFPLMHPLNSEPTIHFQDRVWRSGGSCARSSGMTTTPSEEAYRRTPSLTHILEWLFQSWSGFWPCASWSFSDFGRDMYFILCFHQYCCSNFFGIPMDRPLLETSHNSIIGRLLGEVLVWEHWKSLKLSNILDSPRPKGERLPGPRTCWEPTSTAKYLVGIQQK